MKTCEDSNKSRATNKRRWQAHLSAQARSGLSRAKYCRDHGISYDAMTYWQKKLVAEKSRNQTATLVPVPLVSPASQERQPEGCFLMQLHLSGDMAVSLERVLDN